MAEYADQLIEGQIEGYMSEEGDFLGFDHDQYLEDNCYMNNR